MQLYHENYTEESDGTCFVWCVLTVGLHYQMLCSVRDAESMSHVLTQLLTLDPNRYAQEWDQVDTLVFQLRRLGLDLAVTQTFDGNL